MNARGALLRSIALAAVGLLSSGLAGCGDLLQEPDTGIATLVTVTVVSGDGQTGVPGSALAEPLRVRVASLVGGSTERLWVEWVVIDGSGKVEPRNSFTDADGIAEVTWILGPEKRQRVVAVFAGESETFEADLCEVCPLEN
ncbi:MAG TPA: hypothetical protein VEY33_10155 [Gemmatimonadota bacterium]|nr:hypothetical protein [Gemmatimonadota bacterium]